MKAYSEEVKQQARQMVERGLPASQVADRLNVPPSSIYRWTNPEYVERSNELNRRNKLRYRGTCKACGGPTSGCNGPNNAPEYCRTCYPKTLEHKWSQERVIAAVQEWARRRGAPPTSTEWITRTVDPDGYEFPARSCVYNCGNGAWFPFDAWADAVEAAGFERPLVGGYERSEQWRKNQSERLMVWHESLIIERIQEWNSLYGEPPRSTDWYMSGASEEQIVRFRRADGHWPVSVTVIKRFGTWNKAIAAAGFTPRPKGWPKGKRRKSEGAAPK